MKHRKRADGGLLHRFDLRRGTVGFCIWGVFCASGAVAQTAQGLRVVPRFSVSETWTDNLDLRSTAKDAALITTLSPGLSMSSSSGRIRGALDYALNGLLYTKTQNDKGHVQHALSAQVHVDAVENWLVVDGNASISQQAVSAFGVVAPSAGAGRPGQNTSEVASVSLSPSVKGVLAGRVGYDARVNVAQSHAKDSVAGDNRSTSASLSFSGAGGGALNWSAALSMNAARPSGGRSTKTQSASGSLNLTPDPDIRGSLTAGLERSDLSTNASRSSSTYGLGAVWTPSPRTTADLNWQRHDYGNTHSLSFQHRMARSVWRISDSQSVSNPGVQGAAGLRSNYDLFFLQFASIEPDPVKRDQLVRAFLAANGLSPDAIVTSGFLSGSSSLSRRQDASVSLEGLRSTLTFTFNRNRTQRLDPASAVQDDLSQSGLVLQRGWSLSLSHRLTPESSLSVVLSDQASRGDSSQLATDLKSVIANWNVRLGGRTTLQLTLRHVSFDSVTQPYTENAVLATLVRQF